MIVNFLRVVSSLFWGKLLGKEEIIKKKKKVDSRQENN